MALTVVTPRPAAATTVCSLTTAGSSCTFGQGLFFTADQHPSGAANFDSFLQIQQNGTEQGYNTSAQPAQGVTNTHDLAISSIGTEKIGNVDYLAFFLDVNEAASLRKSYLTLDQLEIFGSNKTDLTGYSNAGANNASGSLNGATKLYDMDTAYTDNAITVNYLLSDAGSGSDLVFYLPKSLFNGYTYVTLYSEFGNINNSNKKYSSDTGFEEWFTKSSIPGAQAQLIANPEPSTLLLLGSGVGFLLRRRKKFFES